MTDKNIARYPLAADGTVRHWLACGPAATPLENLETVVPPTGDPHGKGRRWAMNYWAYHPEVVALKQRVYRALTPFAWTPEATPVVGGTAPADLTWRYSVVRDDQMADFSRFNFAPSLMRGWLFAQVHAPSAMRVTVEIFTIGPVQLWLNERLAYQFDETFSYVAPMVLKTEIELTAGENNLYLHGMMLGWREARLALGLRFIDSPDVEIHLPIGETPAAQWHAADAALSALNLTQFAFPDLPARLTLDTAAEQPVTLDVTVALPAAGGPWAQFAGVDLPQASARLHLAPGEPVDLPLTDEIATAMAQLPGENTLTLTVRPIDGTPMVVNYPLWASRNRFSTQPYGDYESRRREAVQHLAEMYDYDVFAAMAAVETGRAPQISSNAVRVASAFMLNRHDCADFYALSLLALLYRFGDSPALQDADRLALEETFLGFKYWIDEPGIDGMCYCTENHQILFHVTGYLAGQRWPDRIFTNSGWTGRQQQARAASRIKSWILRRLRGGFSEWDSNAYLTMDIFSMLSLVEFADSPRLREMAETLLNKAFFMIASQSYRGAHGSTHGRCYVEGLKSARAENSSNIQRIAWGMGIFNGETRATGMLSMARRYRVPEILQRIGADVARTSVTYARSNAAFRPEFDMHSGEWDVRTITRRTADYMLSAAIDQRPGAMGVQEHLWQATLGPEAAVFTNYPGNNQLHGQARPNFWAGSVRLPRIGMTGRTLAALYRIDKNVGLGFSHAYFPTAFFDEWQLAGQWVFARVGDGYIALWGDGDLHLTASGQHAEQELRSAGGGHAWLCSLGSAVEDGDFDAFRRKVLAHAPQYHADTLTWQTPDGERLSLDWLTPFQVNGEPVTSDAFPHYANAYTDTPMGAQVMDITHAGETLRLNLAHGHRM